MFRLSLMTSLLVSTLAVADDAKNFWVFFGTSPGGKAASKGIYRSEFDSATGKLSEPQLVAEVGNPSFLAIPPSNQFLYSIGEVMSNGKKTGGAHAFSLNAKTGELKKLNDTDSGGAGPAHICVDPKGQCVVVSNYGSGSVKCIKIHDDGKLGTESTFFQHAGSSINSARQKEPHAHSANVSPDGNFVVVADLGTDKLNVYKLEATSGKIEPNQPPYFATHRGAGPRHFAWHPNGKWAYTNGELDATVTAMSYDAKAGTFAKLNVSSTLPNDTPAEVKAKNTTAEVVVHPSGKHVFVSNRGHNSIATFKVKEDGSLEPIGHITGDIKVPRNFNVDPTGRWILVANQDGESVTVFEWDDATATGKPTANKIAIGKPMCIKFVERK